MTISYNWLCDYFPDNLTPKPSPEQISRILTSVGLEVEIHASIYIPFAEVWKDWLSVK